MILSPMRYKGYTWPHNPRVYSIDYQRVMAVHKVPFGRYQLQDLGLTRRVMKGEGEFVGEGAYEEFKKLASIFYSGGPGVLVHPLWQVTNTYFVALRLEQAPRPDYVRYSFEFWEESGMYDGVAARTAETVQNTGGAGQTADQAAYHRVVKGDTLWALSRRYGVKLADLIALNPQALAWRLEYTAGVPCDSFWLRCLWDEDSSARPGDWVGFAAEQDGERVFTGLVDECEVSVSGRGRLLEVSGRGMAARLLDNEALGQDYLCATQADILRDHVTPYGITVAPGANLSPVPQFSVTTGSSEWSVVYEFARYYGGRAPRFDRQGRLVLTGWNDSRERVIDDSAGLISLVRRDKRYGVLSQVLVRDRWSGRVETVDSAAFQAAGGRARRVITMPARSSYKAMRYSGQFQLDKSASELARVEVTVGQAFCAWPGDLVTLQRGGWDWNGRYRAAQVTVGMDESGCWSRLELAKPDFTV